MKNRVLTERFLHSNLFSSLSRVDISGTCSVDCGS